MVDGLVEACLAVYENALRLLSYLVVSFVPPLVGAGKEISPPKLFSSDMGASEGLLTHANK